MSKLILNGDISGRATLEAPPIAGTATYTLPTNSGTVLVSSAVSTTTDKVATTKIQIEIDGTVYYLLATTSNS